MINSLIEEMEDAYLKACSQVKEKHQPLRAKLKELSEQLSLTFNSDIKLRIMKEMDIIEKEIKQDKEQLIRQKETIEREKSRFRKAEYIKQTELAKSKTAYYEAMTLILNQSSSSQKIININYQDWLNVIAFLGNNNFLKMVELTENHHINIAFLSNDFLMLYSVWRRLEVIEAEIKYCLDLLNNS